MLLSSAHAARSCSDMIAGGSPNSAIGSGSFSLALPRDGFCLNAPVNSRTAVGFLGLGTSFPARAQLRITPQVRQSGICASMRSAQREGDDVIQTGGERMRPFQCRLYREFAYSANPLIALKNLDWIE